MNKILLFTLLIITGCATSHNITSINILDGKISSGSTTLSTDDIKEECEIECKE